MSQSDDTHSRSRLAGYQPDILQKAHVLVAGLGALGQNTALNLALLGIGHLWLVDFDSFEAHNATRSPFFPNLEQQTRLSLAKAPIVAERVKGIGTAIDSEVLYSCQLIQLLGDGPIRWADVVVSAVDDVNARAWLAERCRLTGRPLVEGGFSGFRFNISAFSGASGEACYRCLNPSRESSGSCTQYAKEAEEIHITPAIQTAAAVVGGYQAESVVAVLHGDHSQFGRRLYGNVRTLESHIATIPVDPECPGVHSPLPIAGTVNASGMTTIGDLCDAFTSADDCYLHLPELAINRQACISCQRMCDVNAAESIWLLRPLCQECGGPWRRSPSLSPSSSLLVDVHNTQPMIRELHLATLGLVPGGSILIDTPHGSAMYELVGDSPASTTDTPSAA